jgi:hypothetical protein
MSLPSALVGGPLTVSAAATSDAPAKLAFTPGAKEGEFCFDTGLLKGTLHRDGKTSGFQQVVYVPTNTPVAKGTGWFTHYRVMAADIIYPKAWWSWPSTAKLLADGSVEIRWEADEERPFELSAIYRLSAPDTLDLTTVVKARKDLRRFDIFMASYFEGFPSSQVYVKSRPEGGGLPGLLEVTKSLGHLMMSPRDEQALAIVNDGRWKKPPQVIGWKFLPFFEGALAVRRDAKSGLTALLMAPSRDCFAVSTYYGEEPHRSIYMSMFGRDIKTGQTDQAQSRLIVGLRISDEQAIQRYQAYLRSVK